MTVSLKLPQTAREKVFWGEVAGSGPSYLLSQAAAAYNAPLVVVTPDQPRAQQLYYSLQFYFSSNNKIPVHLFPDWETLPYDSFSPHQEIIAERVTLLSKLRSMRQSIIIIPITSLMHCLPPEQYIKQNTFVMDVGETVDIETFRTHLTECGYISVNQVMAPGEFAIRGALIDIFPTGRKHPFRLDLFDDEIESIRLFDPETQRTVDKVKGIRILPAREFPLTEDAIKTFRQNWREQFSGNPTACPLYQDISQGIAGNGIEYYLSLFFDTLLNFFDYLPEQSILCRLGDLTPKAESFWQEVQNRYQQLCFDKQRPLLPPDKIFLPVERVFAGMNHFAQIHISEQTASDNHHGCNFGMRKPPQLTIEHKQTNPLAKLKAHIDTHPGRILFAAETEGRREALLKLLKRIEVHPTQVASWQDFSVGEVALGITVGPLELGLELSDPSLSLLVEGQLAEDHVMQRRARKEKTQDPEYIIRHLTELNIGDPVVHIDHGVGRYQGLVTLDVGEIRNEFLCLAYAGSDKLYVPVASLDLISRYSGGDLEHAPLHKLGSDRWSKAKEKAQKKAHDVACELLSIYAKREAEPGVACKMAAEEYAQFAASFPFEETPDQLRAITETLQDMTSEKHMDRLVCGDVGFGKTEVAMRAAFLATSNNKQVAILVPTTLLAQQHYENFCDRFANWPVKIAVLSRFVSKKEQTATVSGLKSGSVDIVIGTHRLLQEDIQFKSLGLMILDEEHRFGVRQKERLKAFRAEVDILTMTATPIPRTLNLAISHLRDLSLIATPPAKRLAIKTFVHERNDVIIREAILRELLRGGQVYFLHNKVETIEATAEALQKLVPEARIAVAHGQMRERQLEHLMSDFYHRKTNVLVCTTIIETGIDIPSANTIIMDRADRLGLAQLHQLRGRVGRSHHQAYAYLLVPSKSAMTRDAEKRLEAIASLEALGAGFTLATHDLEIRGAGEILGDEQSGHMQEIGFSLYMELLERAVQDLKSGKAPDVDITTPGPTEIDLHLSAIIPEDYLPDVHTRLSLYKRIAHAGDETALEDLQVEMIDRFGLLPTATKHLFAITQLKQVARQMGIKKCDAHSKGGRIEFNANPKVDGAKLIELIQKQPQSYKLDGPEKLRFYFDMPTPEARIEAVRTLLNTLETSHETTHPIH